MRYGLDDCLTHDGGPMVEFYDATYAGPDFGPRGQFVSRYYLSTLMDRRGMPGLYAEYGLCLQGDVPEWVVSARNVAEAIAYARGYAEGHTDGAS